MLPRAESLVFIKCVADAHREFFRMTDVTDRISEYRTCFCDTVRRVVEGCGWAIKACIYSKRGRRVTEVICLLRKFETNTSSFLSYSVTWIRLYMSLPVLLPKNALPQPSVNSHLEWTPKKHLLPPQPPPVDDTKIQEQELANSRQMLDGKIIKKTRPRKTVDYYGGMGRWALVCPNFPSQRPLC